MRLAQFLAFLEIGFRRRERSAAGGMEPLGQTARARVAAAFRGVETRPLGLRLAHARGDRVRVQTRRGQCFDFLAQLATALVIGPVLPLADLRITAFGRGDAVCQRTRQGRLDAAAQFVDA